MVIEGQNIGIHWASVVRSGHIVFLVAWPLWAGITSAFCCQVRTKNVIKLQWNMAFWTPLPKARLDLSGLTTPSSDSTPLNTHD